jgi:hypothetical protein
MRNQFYKKAHVSTALITSIEFIINLNALTIIEHIIKRFGMTYLLKYIFLLSII